MLEEEYTLWSTTFSSYFLSLCSGCGCGVWGGAIVPPSQAAGSRGGRIIILNKKIHAISAV